MSTKIIYDGIKWHLQSGYFTYRPKINGKVVAIRLHKYIYEKFYGKIPINCVVHHKDLNRRNNNIENLQLLTLVEHGKLHNIGRKTFLGRHHTKESKLKISLAHKGIKESRETCRKISEGQLGKKRTEETKLRMREAWKIRKSRSKNGL